MKIFYKEGFKYQLSATFEGKTGIKPHHTIKADYITLRTDGTIWIKKGYAWDGPSGPTKDTKSFMRGSLVHYALYQLMRMDLLPPEFRKQADVELDKLCKEDGMGWFRRNYVIKALSWFGGSAADPKNKKEIKVAP